MSESTQPRSQAGPLIPAEGRIGSSLEQHPTRRPSSPKCWKSHYFAPPTSDAALQVRPGTGTTAPVVTRFAGEARKAIVAAISSGLGQASWSAVGIAARLAGVSMIE